MIGRLVLILACAAALAAAEGVDAVERAFAKGGEDNPFLAQDLMQVVDGLPVAEQAVALAHIGAKRTVASGVTLRHYLGGTNAVLVAAAIHALAKAWPTCIADAEAVRAHISARDPQVADAACAFAVQVGDDRAITELINRFGNEPTNQATVRALLALTGHSAQTAGAWNEWWKTQGQKTKGTISRLADAIDSKEAKRINDAMMPLLGERRGASDIADLLIQATTHPNVAIVEAALAGLSTCPGPVAACWRLEQKTQPTVVVAAIPTLVGVGTQTAEEPAAPLGSNLGLLLGMAAAISITAGLVVVWRGGGHAPAPAPVPVNVEPISTRIVRRKQRMTWLN